QCHLPCWSPDGKRIAFSVLVPGKRRKINLVSSEGGIPQQVMSEEWSEWDVNWSPDGESLLFGVNSESGATSSIHLLDLKSHHISTIHGSDRLFSPRWSPDGRYVAAMPTDSQKLLVFDFNTRKWTELLKIPVGYPSWSKDEKYIYFNQPAGTAMYRVRISDR